ncbi:MAG: TRAP transporter substrate-binding protein [Spirochaetales bacterium]|jgi:tripartite ATP-independent transporter DctP family solute receptor|nr:TRAP transporter substrate-binding protein [Spirochaetales bacterium]
MKKLLNVSVTLLVTALIFTGCSKAASSGSGTASPEQKAVTLSLNHVGAANHFYHGGALKFAELMKEASGGAVTVDVFPASQIASGAKAIEFVQMGTLDLALESTMALENFVPEAGILNLPFVFKTKKDAFRILDGDIGKELEKAAEAKGFKIIAWWDNGFRAISNSSRPVKRPQDVKGLKIRVPESKVFIETFQILGAVPTAMAVAEVFSALQLHTVDGQENTLANFINNKYAEVNKFVSDSRHIYTAEPLIMSLGKFNDFPKNIQDALLKAAQKAGEYERELSLQTDEKDIEAIKAAGVQVDNLTDINEWIAAVQPVYKSFPQFDSLRQRIQAEQK